MLLSLGIFSSINIPEWVFLMAGRSPHRGREDLALICVLVSPKSGWLHLHGIHIVLKTRHGLDSPCLLWLNSEGTDALLA